MRVEAIGFEKLPGETPDNLAYRYVVGYKSLDSGAAGGRSGQVQGKYQL